MENAVSDLQFTFSLKSETRKGRSSGASVEKVDLAFEDEADAIRWRDAIIEQVLL